jgi:ADP-ribose pyrophosphatase
MSEERPQVVSSERVFHASVFDVRTDRIRYSDGAEHRIDVVVHGGSFAILAVPAPGEVMLVRQYRHAVAETLWELPAGTAEKDEDPAVGAARELREETGYTAERIRHVGSAYMTPGFCDEVMHFFMAEGLTAGEQALDPDERIEVATFTHDAAWRLVAEGRIGDAKTILALLWAEGTRGEIGRGFGR